MGTTSTAIRTGEGLQVCWVLAIEGYERLITDHGNLGAITTAWAGTDWSLALSGLETRGHIAQGFEPWDDSIGAPELTFAVQPDDADTFGIAVHKLKPTFKTRQTAVFTPAADGSGTLDVKQTTGLPASGSLYYGGRQLKYTATSSTTVTVSTSNHYAPFAGDGGNRYSPAHQIPAGQFLDTASPPKVQDTPRTWIGKKVALYLCRVVNGVVDSPSQAQLEFAGRIKRIYEDQKGFTCLECVDLRADIRDCVLHRDQWVGYVREGIRLQAGTKLRTIEKVSGTTATSTTFTVVSSGASGSSEVNEGVYSIWEIVERIDKWLQANSATFSSDWSCGIRPMGNSGSRLVFLGDRSGAVQQSFTFQCNRPHLMQTLGFEANNAGPLGYYEAVGSEVSTSAYILASPNTPYRIKSTAHTIGNVADHRGQDPEDGYTIDIAAAEGTWWNHSSYLPQPYNDWANGENYSLLKVGNQLCWGKYSSATQIVNVVTDPTSRWVPSRPGNPVDYGLTVDDPGEHLEVRQVVALSGSFSELVPRLFASLNGNGTNHATYDVFPFGAGIPWDLLGDDFLASVRSLEQSSRTGGMVILLPKPTKLVDVLLPELLLRFAWVIFKDGGYQLVSPPTPNALDTDFTLDETNKAGHDLDLRSTSEVTQKWLRNVVKVDYGRTLEGDYTKHLTVIDQTSIADYGESSALTIRAANAYADAAGTGVAVEDLAVNLIAKVLPFFARPMKVVTRSISPALFHISPGATVTMNDDFVRDPTTGRRGMSNRAGVVIDTWHDWGAGGGRLTGELRIMFSEEDRTYPMAPCAEVDETYDTAPFTDGYDSGNLRLKLKQHQHSRSTDDKDVTRFAIGDEIRVIELDPADSSAPRAWDVTIDELDTANDVIGIDAALTGFSASERYRVVSQLYTAVTEDQQLFAFIADDADGLILDEAEPNLWGETAQGAYTSSALTTLPRLIPNEMDDEGRPFHAGLMADLAINLNHLVNYGCARSLPVAMASNEFINHTGTSYELQLSWPFPVMGEFQPGTARRLTVAPEVKTTGGTGYCRITISKTPPKGSSLTEVKWEGVKYQREFTFTNTSRAVLTPQTMTAIMGGYSGVIYVSIELKATGGQTTTYYGLAEQELGPVQAI